MDGGNPRLSSTTVVAVTVRRNLAAPVFRQARYDTTIPETQAPGSLILTIQADDSDVSVSISIDLLNCLQSYNTGDFRTVWSYISVGDFTFSYMYWFLYMYRLWQSRRIASEIKTDKI